MGTHAWIDASAGIAGDMLLGALVDAGASLASVRDAVEAVIPETVTITANPVTRAGLRAIKIDVAVRAPDQHHRPWRDIEERLRGAELAAPVRDRAVAAFTRLAAAEGEVHGVPAEEVEFHEVGAWDSIADVVGVCAALHDLGVSTLSTGVIAVGSGRTRIAHGEVGVPVPAVVVLSRGWRVRAGGEGELATPTGMALLAALCDCSEELPDLVVTGSGLGAGSRDRPGRANVTRVVVGDRAADQAPRALDEAVLLESNVDDLDPRLWPGVLDTLLAAGASDAWLTPILMKKGRPAQQLSVLCPVAVADQLQDLIMERTSTIGIRRHLVGKYALPRGWTDVDLDGITVSIKIAHREGTIVRVTPEFDTVVAASERLGEAPAQTLVAAERTAAEQDLRPGRPVPPDLRPTP